MIKSLAEGKLFLWDRNKLRWRAVECSISEDIYGVWCLLSQDRRLRVPLASMCMVHVVSAAKLQFRIIRFAEKHLTFRVPALPVGMLHYWVATLQTLSSHACHVVSPVVWSGAWAAVRLQSKWRGVRGKARARAARQRARTEQAAAEEAAEAAQLQAMMASAVADA